MKRGFSLIELMLALAIGSVLSGILYMSLFQSNRAADMVENITNMQIRILIAQRQMRRDLAGICIPLHIFSVKNEQQNSQESTEDGKKTEQKSPVQENNKEQDKERAKKQLAQAFNAQSSDSIFGQLLFITNNPLEVYWSNKVGYPKFKLEKVLYHLEPEKDSKKPSFRLMRTIVPFDANKEKEKKQSQELITGIKSMRVAFKVFKSDASAEDQKGPLSDDEKKSNDDVKKPKKEEAQKKELKIFSDWPVATMADDDIRLQKKVPEFIEITIELWNITKTAEESFIFTIPVLWQDIEKKSNNSAQQSIENMQKKPEKESNEPVKEQNHQIQKIGRR